MRKIILPLLFHALLLTYIGVIIIGPIRHRVSITPPGSVYMHQHRILEDYYFYLMVIRQGREGFQEFDQYTTEPTNPTAMHMFYLALGFLGEKLSINNVNLYYMGMISGVVFFYFFAWLLASCFFPNAYKYTAMMVFFAASPFPIADVNVLGRSVSIGTSWWTNMDPYGRLTQVPHHFIGQALMLSATYYTLMFIRKKSFIYAIGAALATGVGIFFYSVPIGIFLLATTLTVSICTLKPLFFAVKSKTLMSLVKRNEKLIIGLSIVGGVAIIAILYIQSILANPGWPWSTFLSWEANWYNHKIEIYPYTIGVYLLSYGLLPLFLLPALVSIYKKRSFYWFFVLFLTITPIALYLTAANHFLNLPKIRFIHSAPYVFAGLLATLGIKTILELFKNKHWKIAAAACITLLFIANWVFGLKSYWFPEFQKYEIFYNTYIPHQYFTVIEYLNKHTKPFSNIFASYAVGVYLPAFTKNNSFVGHMVSTYDFWTKYSQANSFFAHSMTEKEALELFRRHNISIVIGEEKGLGVVYKNILKPVFSIEDLTLYTPVYE